MKFTSGLGMILLAGSVWAQPEPDASFGGVYGRLYQLEHPRDVSGFIRQRALLPPR